MKNILFGLGKIMESIFHLILGYGIYFGGLFLIVILSWLIMEGLNVESDYVKILIYFTVFCGVISLLGKIK
tara:strand:+ start:204 stop:416 length:213 start_codon:yes stop_codon:yes gene_type:complete